MKILEVKAFQCEFCNKIYRHKSSGVRHEKSCFANPTTKACRTCKHFKIEWETVYVPPHGGQNYGDADYEEKVEVCEKGIEISGGRFKHNCEKYEQGDKNF